MSSLIHAYTAKRTVLPTIVKTNQLIHRYAEQGLLEHAQRLFDEMPERNVFSWNAIIAAHLKNHDLLRAEYFFSSSPVKDSVSYNSMLSGYVSADGYELNALRLFAEMHRDAVAVDEFTVTTLLNLAAKLSLLSLGMQMHAFMIKGGSESSKFSVSSLIDMYSKCGCFSEACGVFHLCGLELDLVSKNAMVAACCREGKLEMGMDIFFHQIELNDTVSWNTVTSGLEQNGHYEKSLKLFVSMVDAGVRFNEHTLASVLGACSGLKSLSAGKEVHAQVLRGRFHGNPYICSGIVDMYSKCANMESAEAAHVVFGMQNNAFSITSLIVGYSSQGNMIKAQSFYDSLTEKNSAAQTALFSGYVNCQQCESAVELLRESIVAKEHNVLETPMLMSLLGACALQASLNLGKEVHCYILRNLIAVDEKLMSSIIDMYAKCGSICYAKTLFDKLFHRDSVLYNVMIAGYAHHGYEDRAVALFEEMLGKLIRPQAATFIAVLSACRHAGLLELGAKYFESMEKEHNVSPEIDHYACMVDLFGRAKQLDRTIQFMRSIPIPPDAAMWGAFLNACKTNGNLQLAREAEDELVRIGEGGARYVQLANWHAADRNWSEMQRLRKEMKEKEVRKLPGCSWLYVDNGVSVFISGDTTHPNSETIYSMLNCLNSETDRLIVDQENYH